MISTHSTPRKFRIQTIFDFAIPAFYICRVRRFKKALPLNAKVLSAGFALVFVLLSAFAFSKWRNDLPSGVPINDLNYDKILGDFRAAGPLAVSVSPDGKYVLAKGEKNHTFKLSVLDRSTKREVAFHASRNSQVSVTWRPDSCAIAFQEIAGVDRPLCILDVKTGKQSRIPALLSQTALPALRWDPTGRKLACFEGDWRGGRLLVVDLSNDSRPVVLENSMSVACDFAWSPDGTRIAATASDEGSIDIVSLSTRKKSRLPVLQGEIRDLAWSPDGKMILAAGRGSKDEFFNLFKVKVDSGEVSVKVQTNGDAGHPIWLQDSKSFVYHVSSNGTATALLGTSFFHAFRRIGPTNGDLRILHPGSDGKSVYAHFAGLATPPTLLEINVDDGTEKILYSHPEPATVRASAPVSVTIESGGGNQVPAFLWKASPQADLQPSALIMVHGGNHTQDRPLWEDWRATVTSLGCSIIAENHRGSAGFGRSYEEMAGDPVEDIAAACAYATNDLKVNPRRVFVLGTSLGAYLTAAFAARGGEFGGLFLVSWPGGDPPVNPRFRNTYPVFEFHGQTDTILSAREARRSVERFFTKNSQSSADIQFHVFENEPHYFYQVESRAAIFWELSRLIRQIP